MKTFLVRLAVSRLACIPHTQPIAEADNVESIDKEIDFSAQRNAATPARKNQFSTNIFKVLRPLATFEYGGCRLAALNVFILFSLILAQPFSGHCSPINSSGHRKKIIEFGWGEPNTRFIRENIAQMERRPFDGLVFNARTTGSNRGDKIFAQYSFGRYAFSRSELEPAIADLRATNFNKFTENFLRYNIAPGDIGWFENFRSVLKNASNAARIVRQGRIRGIFFDLEQYNRKLFSYPVVAKDSGRSFLELYNQVRMRGKQFAKVYSRRAPRSTIFLSFGYEQSLKKSSDLKLDDYGLLPAFIDGLLEGSDSRTIFVNGYEDSYAYREEKDFAWGLDQVKNEMVGRSQVQHKYRSQVQVGFGIWMDLLSPTKGWNATNVFKNERTPRDFQVSMINALRFTEKYVWVYTEQPRWWEDKNLPREYEQALFYARWVVGLK